MSDRPTQTGRQALAANFDAATSKSLTLGLWLEDPSPPINHGRLSDDALQAPVSRHALVRQKTSDALAVLARFDKMFQPASRPAGR